MWAKGKPHERTIRGTKREGDLFEARFRVQLEATNHDVRSVLRFGQLCTDKYSPYAQANLARSTWRARSYVIETLCLFFGKKKLTEIVMGDIEAFKAERREAKVGPATINGELRAFLTVLHWAKKQGYPVTIPPVRYLREPKGRVRIWTREEVARLMAAARARHPQVLRLIVFLLNTGCRKGEAIAAEWSWLDFERGIIRIPASKEWAPKSGRAREVPMSDACRAVLELPDEERLSDRWVFPNRDGVRFEFFPDAIFKELQTKAGITGGAHTLRHCYASEFLANGGTMFDLSQILGHTHERISAVYSHLLPGHLERARNVVNIAPPTMGAASDDSETGQKTA